MRISIQDPGDCLSTRKRIPRLLSKKTRKQRKAISRPKLAAELEAEVNSVDGNFDLKFDMLCLPCEDKAYDNEIFSKIGRCNVDRSLADEDGAQSTVSPRKPLCNDMVSVYSQGSTRPWLAGADEGRRSRAINLKRTTRGQDITETRSNF